jgi:hypothetical protein
MKMTVNEKLKLVVQPTLFNYISVKQTTENLQVVQCGEAKICVNENNQSFKIKSI